MRSELLAAEAFGDRDQTGRFRDVIEAYRRPPYFSQSIPDGAGETCWSGCSTIVVSACRRAFSRGTEALRDVHCLEGEGNPGMVPLALSWPTRYS